MPVEVAVHEHCPIVEKNEEDGVIQPRNEDLISHLTNPQASIESRLAAASLLLNSPRFFIPCKLPFLFEWVLKILIDSIQSIPIHQIKSIKVKPLHLKLAIWRFFSKLITFPEIHTTTLLKPNFLILIATTFHHLLIYTLTEYERNSIQISTAKKSKENNDKMKVEISTLEDQDSPALIGQQIQFVFHFVVMKQNFHCFRPLLQDIYGYTIHMFKFTTQICKSYNIDYYYSSTSFSLNAFPASNPIRDMLRSLFATLEMTIEYCHNSSTQFCNQKVVFKKIVVDVLENLLELIFHLETLRISFPSINPCEINPISKSLLSNSKEEIRFQLKCQEWHRKIELQRIQKSLLKALINLVQQTLFCKDHFLEYRHIFQICQKSPHVLKQIKESNHMKINDNEYILRLFFKLSQLIQGKMDKAKIIAHQLSLLLQTFSENYLDNRVQIKGPSHSHLRQHMVDDEPVDSVIDMQDDIIFGVSNSITNSSESVNRNLTTWEENETKVLMLDEETKIYLDCWQMFTTLLSLIWPPPTSSSLHFTLTSSFRLLKHVQQHNLYRSEADKNFSMAHFKFLYQLSSNLVSDLEKTIDLKSKKEQDKYNIDEIFACLEVVLSLNHQCLVPNIQSILSITWRLPQPLSISILSFIQKTVKTYTSLRQMDSFILMIINALIKDKVEHFFDLSFWREFAFAIQSLPPGQTLPIAQIFHIKAKTFITCTVPVKLLPEMKKKHPTTENGQEIEKNNPVSKTRMENFIHFVNLFKAFLINIHLHSNIVVSLLKLGDAMMQSIVQPVLAPWIEIILAIKQGFKSKMIDKPSNIEAVLCLYLNWTSFCLYCQRRFNISLQYIQSTSNLLRSDMNSRSNLLTSENILAPFFSVIHDDQLELTHLVENLLDHYGPSSTETTSPFLKFIIIRMIFQRSLQLMQITHSFPTNDNLSLLKRMSHLRHIGKKCRRELCVLLALIERQFNQFRQEFEHCLMELTDNNSKENIDNIVDSEAAYYQQFWDLCCQNLSLLMEFGSDSLRQQLVVTIVQFASPLSNRGGDLTRANLSLNSIDKDAIKTLQASMENASIQLFHRTNFYEIPFIHQSLIRITLHQILQITLKIMSWPKKASLYIQNIIESNSEMDLNKVIKFIQKETKGKHSKSLSKPSTLIDSEPQHPLDHVLPEFKVIRVQQKKLIYTIQLLLRFDDAFWTSNHARETFGSILLCCVIFPSTLSPNASILKYQPTLRWMILTMTQVVDFFDDSYQFINIQVIHHLWHLCQEWKLDQDLFLNWMTNYIRSLVRSATNIKSEPHQIAYNDLVSNILSLEESQIQFDQKIKIIYSVLDGTFLALDQLDQDQEWQKYRDHYYISFSMNPNIQSQENSCEIEKSARKQSDGNPIPNHLPLVPPWVINHIHLIQKWIYNQFMIYERKNTLNEDKKDEDLVPFIWIISGSTRTLDLLRLAHHRNKDLNLGSFSSSYASPSITFEFHSILSQVISLATEFLILRTASIDQTIEQRLYQCLKSVILFLKIDTQPPNQQEWAALITLCISIVTNSDNQIRRNISIQLFIQLVQVIDHIQAAKMLFSFFLKELQATINFGCDTIPSNSISSFSSFIQFNIFNPLQLNIYHGDHQDVKNRVIYIHLIHLFLSNLDSSIRICVFSQSTSTLIRTLLTLLQRQNICVQYPPLDPIYHLAIVQLLTLLVNTHDCYISNKDVGNILNSLNVVMIKQQHEALLPKINENTKRLEREIREGSREMAHQNHFLQIREFQGCDQYLILSYSTLLGQLIKFRFNFLSKSIPCLLMNMYYLIHYATTHSQTNSQEWPIFCLKRIVRVHTDMVKKFSSKLKPYASFITSNFIKLLEKESISLKIKKELYICIYPVMEIMSDYQNQAILNNLTETGKALFKRLVESYERDFVFKGNI